MNGIKPDLLSTSLVLFFSRTSTVPLVGVIRATELVVSSGRDAPAGEVTGVIGLLGI
ncbi:MAG: hypothetical protein ACOC2Z_16855 [Coleofasciculus sp.]